MVDNEHANVAGQAVDSIEDDVTLGARHPGRGLVQEQHLRPQAERDGNLDQTLAAIGQLDDPVPGIVRQLQHLQQMH
jgi:hypothetical protein